MNTTKLAAKWCAAALIIAAVATGCSNEEMGNNAGNPIENGTVTIVASVDQPANTRLEYEDEGSGPMKTYWTSTDAIGIYLKGYYGAKYTNSLSEGEKAEKTEFTGSLVYDRTEPGYIAVYPVGPGGAVVSSTTDYNLTSEGQTQNGNDNTEHLSAYDYMYDDEATIEEVEDSSPTKYRGEVNFKRQMAMLKFVLTIPGYDIETNGAIANISLSATDELFTTSKKLDATADSDAYGVTLGLTGMEDYENSTTPLTAYMMILPANLSGETAIIEVTTASGHRFSVSKTVNREFKAGRYYTMTVASGWALSGNTPMTFSNGTTPAESFSGFDGTSEYTPFYITNEYELKKLVDDVAGGEPYTDTYFKLDADIEITADSWISIGNGTAITRAGSTHFAGHFNGNGHSITGQLNISGAANIGFFGYVNGGSIKNLHNKATVTVVNGMQAGSIVGKIENGLISNCTNTGDIEGYNYTGGIVGIAEKAHIINCVNRGNITGDGTSLGGIVSHAEGYVAGEPAAITNCENYGTITSSGGRVGGIAGETGSPAVIINSKNEGKIICTKTNGNYYIGGIVGKSAGNISYSTNNGEVQTGGSTVGGIAGHTIKDITYCTNSGKISGAARLGGILGHNYGGNIHKNHNASTSITGTHAASNGTITGYIESGTVYDCNTSVTVGTLGLVGSSYSTSTCTVSGHK